MGVVTLRRLADAIEDGDTIHAIIRGSAVNNDGSGKVNYLAPSVDGQAGAIAEAIALANDSKYGLTASVFGNPNDKRLQKVADKLESGNVLMNDVGPTNFAMPSVPWGGWKNSGPGFSHSLEGMLDTTLLQTQTRNELYRLPLLRKQPWHFKDATKTKAPKPNQSENPFSTSLIKSFASPKRRDKLKPSFWVQVLKNRSKTKL